MSLLNIFTHDEPAAGLEISDNYLRLAVLRFTLTGKNHSPEKEKDSLNSSSAASQSESFTLVWDFVEQGKAKVEIKGITEQALPDGLVVDGVIQDKVRFSKALKGLLKSSRLKVRYLIISLPANNIYCRVFSFPPALQKEKLEEAMKLAMDFQLPIKSNQAYFDWEKIESGAANKVFLAAAPKVLINTYIDVFNSAKLKPIAIEFHPMSFARVVDVPSGAPVLAATFDKTSVLMSIIKNKLPRFVRVVPNVYLSKGKAEEEMRKIADFYESEDERVEQILNVRDLNIADSLVNKLLPKKDSAKWLISVGAAWRGLLPLAQDTIVSLMPVGTEDAYKYQKTTVFAEFLSNVAVGLSLFFIAVYLGALALMMSIQQNTLSRVERLNSSVPASDYANLESRAAKFNEMVIAASSTLKSIPSWSLVMEELQSKVTEGVVVNEVLMPSPEGVMKIKGIAKNRNQLNLFRKSLEQSNLFTEVKLPLTNLEQKENIPFSLTFRIKDLISIYLH